MFGFGSNNKSNNVQFSVDVWDQRTGVYVQRDTCKAPNWDAVVKHYSDMGYTVKEASGRATAIAR